MPAIFQARTGLLYLHEESSYATAPALASTDAFRHVPGGQKLTFNPKNLVDSPERHTSPDQKVKLVRRRTGSFNIKAMLYPSGTLNTLPEANQVLKNVFEGGPTNITLSTTVASGGATTGAVVASATGLAAGQWVQITMLGGSYPGVYMRFLTSVASATLVWTPALPAAVATSDLVKGAVTYTFATALPKSIDIAHYPQAPSANTPAREMLGCVVNNLTLSFDSNGEPMIEFSGPAQGLAGTSPNFTPQSKPASFTTVGAETGIPSGLTGAFLFAGTQFGIQKLDLSIDASMDLVPADFGSDRATNFYRRGKRKTTAKIDAITSDDLTLWTPAMAASYNPCMLQCGTTSGSIVAVYCPSLLLDGPPDIGDDDEINTSNYSGEALAVAGNDAVYLGFA